MFSKHWILLMMAAVPLIGATGCADGPEIPTTFSVSGKVTYKGQPFADAEVGFVSKLDNKDIKSARGKTNANGEFRLTTYLDPEHEVAGATPGEFVVTVVKNNIPPADVLMKDFFQNPAYVPKAAGPTKYGDARQSPLTATVTKDESKNTFEFNLED